MVGTVAGAAVGAQLHVQPEYPHSAEVVVEADRAGGGLDKLETRRAVRLARLEEVLGLPQVETAVKETTSARGNLRKRVKVKASPASGLLRITAHDRSPAEAVELAKAFVAQSLSFIRGLDALDGHLFVLGDFEAGLEGWGGTSHFAVPPNSLRIARAGPKFNSAALDVICQPRVACGPSVRFFYPFQADRVYKATGWLRAPTSRFSVTMILGAGPGDYASLQPTKLQRGWKRYSLQWVPKRDYRSAELAIQTASRSSAQFFIDGVSLASGHTSVRAGSGRAAERAEAGAFARDPYVTASPAVPTGELDRRTGLWTLLGAAFGLLAAASAVGIGWAASRRRQE
jgi:hypothetical protein